MHGMISTAPSLLLTNAILVLSNEVIQGTVQIVNGEIAAMDSGSTSVANAIDCHGDLLMPGLVELHTDNLEKHAVPRPEVRWPTVAAVLAHDAELAAAGITTALNAVTVGSFLEDSLRDQRIDDCIDAIAWAQAERLTKVDHYFHFCCEISAPNALDLLNKHGDTNRLRLVSVVDHTPGQRQWAHIDNYRVRVRKLEGLDDHQIDMRIQQRCEYQQRYAEPHARAICAWARQRRLPLASHDDAGAEHAIDASMRGIGIAAFPTTQEAATMAKWLGMRVVMGSPNLMLGGSHSGNVATAELAAQRVLDILSSDYVPASLLPSALELHATFDFSLPEAIATVTTTPAQAVGLTDRGVLAVGKRADMLRVSLPGRFPVIRSVWRAGERVA